MCKYMIQYSQTIVTSRSDDFKKEERRKREEGRVENSTKIYRITSGIIGGPEPV